MRYELPGLRPRSKVRPQKAGNGHMFIPDGYTEWKQSIRENLAVYRPVPILGPCVVTIAFHAPTRPAGDVDNLAGGLLDAIQPPRARGDVRAQRSHESLVTPEERLAGAPGCLILDDKQVVELSVRWVQSHHRMIVIEIREVEIVPLPKRSRKKGAG